MAIIFLLIVVRFMFMMALVLVVLLLIALLVLITPRLVLVLMPGACFPCAHDRQPCSLGGGFGAKALISPWLLVMLKTVVIIALSFVAMMVLVEMVKLILTTVLFC